MTDDEKRAKRRAYQRARYAANPTKIKDHNARWRAANPGKLKAAHQAWADANPDKMREAKRKWALENPDKVKAMAEAYREIRNAKRRAAYSIDPEKKATRRRYCTERRARKRGAEGSYTPDDIAAILKAQRSKCAHPWCRVSIKVSYELDHILALSKGGSNWPKNLQLLCMSCNRKKHAKDAIDFCQENGMLI